MRGGTDGHFKPWQRAVTSFAGPATPTLIGWLLLFWWRSKRGRHFRARYTVADEFLTCIDVMLVFGYAVAIVPMMFGFLADGDWNGFIHDVPGPHWLTYSLLTISCLVSLEILFKTARHAYTLISVDSVTIRRAVATTSLNPTPRL